MISLSSGHYVLYFSQSSALPISSLSIPHISVFYTAGTCTLKQANILQVIFSYPNIGDQD